MNITLSRRIRVAIATLVLLGAATASLTGCQVVDEIIEAVPSSVPQPDDTSQADLPMTVETRIIRVIDGDTVAVTPVEGVLEATNDEKTEHVVRVLGIDAPEMNYFTSDPECGAQHATDHLETLLPEYMPVTIQYDGRADRSDKYGRSLAYVTTQGGTDVGLAQVTDGYAMPWYPNGEPVPERVPAYTEAADAAIDAEAGAHGECQVIGRD